MSEQLEYYYYLVFSDKVKRDNPKHIDSHMKGFPTFYKAFTYAESLQLRDEDEWPLGIQEVRDLIYILPATSAGLDVKESLPKSIIDDLN